MRERRRSDGQQAQASQVFSFGWNGHGQLGCGDMQARLAPQLLRDLGGLSLCGLACGSCHCIAIDAQGGAHIEEVYPTELDALRANKNNTDPTRRVRFLPYGIAVSVLDAASE